MAITSASVATLPDGNLLVNLGHRCKTGDTRTSWQLHRVEVESRSASQIATDFQAGTYASFARTNNIFLAPNGETAYFTVADGITANTVGLMQLNLADDSISMLVERQLVQG